MLRRGPLQVGVLCSSRAPGLAELLAHPKRGKSWDIACIVTTDASMRDRHIAAARDVPLVTHPIREFLAGRNTSLSDYAARRDYDAQTAKILTDAAVDAVVLLGYLYFLTPAFLVVFPGRVINVHDSDLSDLDARGEPRFVGLHSTRDAILAGVVETRSSVHLVTEKLDAGPLLGVSQPYPVASFASDAALAGHHDIVRPYACAQREWMMRTSWASLAANALDLIADDLARRSDPSRDRAMPSLADASHDAAAVSAS